MLRTILVLTAILGVYWLSPSGYGCIVGILGGALAGIIVGHSSKSNDCSPKP